MDLIFDFITPHVGALIVSIVVMISVVKKIRPQIKHSRFWFNAMPYLPAVIGMVLVFIPGVVESKDVGPKLIVGIASAGIATMGRNMLKRTFLDSFNERQT